MRIKSKSARLHYDGWIFLTNLVELKASKSWRRSIKNIKSKKIRDHKTLESADKTFPNRQVVWNNNRHSTRSMRSMRSMRGGFRDSSLYVTCPPLLLSLRITVSESECFWRSDWLFRGLELLRLRPHSCSHCYPSPALFGEQRGLACASLSRHTCCKGPRLRKINPNA